MEHSPLLGTMLALLVIVPAVRIGGNVAATLRQPRVIGEIACGLLLGALATACAPTWLAADGALKIGPVLSLVANLGIVFMLFQLGMDFDFSHLRVATRQRAVASISLAGIALPFAGGVAMRLLYAAATDGAWTPASAAFCGIAFAITALPVLARILVETGLANTPLGAIAIACAGIKDLVGWIALAALAALQARADAGGTLATIGWLAAFFAALFLVFKPLARRFVPRIDALSGQGGYDRLALMLVAVLGASAATVALGLHGAIGAFALGVALHDRHDLREAWQREASPLVYTLLVPVFFVLTGARLRLGEMALDGFAFGLAWLAAACVAKILGSYLGARLAGMADFDAWRLGVLLNTRGLTELVVLNLGLDLGLISPTLFTFLVMMALASTVATVPVVRWLQRTGARRPVPASADMGLMR